jgi:hypothetical protein
MNWAKVAKAAKLVAYAVVPGAAGYVAYKHVVRPWLDKRAAKGRASATARQTSERNDLPNGSQAGNADPGALPTFGPPKSGNG